MSLEDFKMRHKVFLKACEKEGRDPDDILISTTLCYDGDAQATIQQAREYEEAGVKSSVSFLYQRINLQKSLRK